MIATVTLPLPLNKPFDYAIPDNLSIKTGQRVIVPFGKRFIPGYVTNIADNSAQTADLKEIVCAADSSPFLDDKRMTVAKWIASYYFCSLGEALRLFFPKMPKFKVILEKDKPQITLSNFLPKNNILLKLNPSLSANASEKLKSIEYPISLKDLRKKAKMTSNEIRDLIYSGILLINEAIEETAPHKPTAAQQQIIDSITPDNGTTAFKTHLLFGVTGSGKTEVYLQLIEKALNQGQSAICLVPEISLTPQMFNRFRERLGETVAMLHSGMSEFERYYNWLMLSKGIKKVAFGARSALFAPVQNPGIIIVDEEHEQSYKQSDKPRYNARDTAIYMAKLYDIPVVLGSATPQIETYYKALKGKFQLHKLTTRVGEAKMPEIRFVDLKKKMFPEILTDDAIDEIEKRLSKKEQVIIFHNRRGFSNFLMCKDCGYTFRCEHCDVTLTYHKRGNVMRCHWCGAYSKIPDKCPECGSTNIGYFGTGTQRIEDELVMHFPEARIQRMDLDTTRAKGSYSRIIRKFEKGEIDILTGTQMVTKGFDFPRVTLVIIVSADILLNFPDFRSAERAFQLVTQVAGRAGRKELLGEVLVQTYNTEHYSFKYALAGDYEGFYKKEIDSRLQHNYPPFTRIISVVFEGKDEKEVERKTEELAEKLRSLTSTSDTEIDGPLLPIVSRIMDRYRFAVIIKGRNSAKLHRALYTALADFKRGKFAIKIDTDPISA